MRRKEATRIMRRQAEIRKKENRNTEIVIHASSYSA
jgi:hypothetical protein